MNTFVVRVRHGDLAHVLRIERGLKDLRAFVRELMDTVGTMEQGNVKVFPDRYPSYPLRRQEQIYTPNPTLGIHTLSTPDSLSFR